MKVGLFLEDVGNGEGKAARDIVLVLEMVKDNVKRVEIHCVA
jgi:hypothetical protein